MSRSVIMGGLVDEGNEYKIGLVTLFLLVYAVVYHIIMFSKYSQVDEFEESVLPFLMQNTLSLVLTFTGIMLHILVVNKNPRIGTLSGIALIWGVAVFVASGAIQAYFRVLQKYSVSPGDLYMLYVALAVSEEVCFRFGVQSLFESLVEERWGNRILAGFVGIPLASLVFLLPHFFVYHETTQLGIVFLVSLVFGLGYWYTKNTDTSVVAHVGTNLIAGAIVVYELFGGF